ncbi:TPA: hypothetical protein ACXLHF_004055 [Klebsiella pneumoniae]
MKFSDYIKQIKECESEIFIIINYKNEKFVYKNENKYDDLEVTGDGFIKVEEYLSLSTPCIEVFLSDSDEKSNCFVLEILKMKHKKELKRKQKAKQDLEEYNKMWDKHNKEQKLELITCVVGFLLVIGVSWLLSKIG